MRWLNNDCYICFTGNNLFFVKLKSIIFSIWFLALIIAFPAIVIVIQKIEKYNISLVNKKLSRTHELVHFADLDSDGTKEKILSFLANDEIFSIQCLHSNGTLEDQYNFPKSFSIGLRNIFFDDTNKNGFTEIYGFTINSDSVFLNYIEPFNENDEFTTIFITTVNTDFRKELDVYVPEVLFADLNGDGLNEVIFSVEVGYNWFPRKIYAFDASKGKIKESQNFGSHFNSFAAVDVNSDGRSEILCVSSSAHNIPKETPVKYVDDRSRLFLFDSDLNELRPPINFSPGLGSRTKYFITGENKIIVNHINKSYNPPLSYAFRFDLEKFQPEGDTLFYNLTEIHDIQFFQETENTFAVFSTLGNFFRINERAEIIYKKKFGDEPQYSLRGMCNFENSGLTYFVSSLTDQKLCIYFDEFKRKYELINQDYSTSLVVVKVPNKPEFIVISNSLIMEYEITRNRLFFLIAPVILGIYFLSVFFIWVIRYSLIRQIQQKIDLQNQVRDLQLKTLKNQLDPHFIFNTFNTIASVIKQGRNEEAYDVMVLFSKLLRQNMDNSNAIYTSLKAELGFVRGYLSIQKYRFTDLFDFTIEVEKGTNTSVTIPKMLLQIHVENSLKHGIRPLGNNGLLVIKISQELQKIIIIIEDNGIGREKAKQYNTESSKIGLTALSQIIDLNNKNQKNNIQQEIIDIKDENGEALGTRVVITISQI